MKTKKLSLFFNFLIIIYGISLISRADLFKDNLSGISLKYYYGMLIFGCLMFLGYYRVIDKLCNKHEKVIFILSLIFAFSLPYFKNHIILANIHIILCYIAFFLMNYIVMKVIKYYRIYNIKKSYRLFNIYLIMLMLMLIIYIKVLSVVGMMEIVFLVGISLIFGLINYEL